VEQSASARIPLRGTQFQASVFISTINSDEHIALALGDISSDEPVLVRVHSECLTGDVFGSARCDCGEQLELALDRIIEAGRGVVVYLRGQEGRGIGLTHKLRAYQLQDGGVDTVDANLSLGLPVDSREYGIGAQILRTLGVKRVRLMTNNPAKYRGLTGYGIEITAREPITVRPNPENLAYLLAKRARMDHLLSASDVLPPTAPEGQPVCK
jgi:3,4-dihydroxy 2-butanone 4-phosphate synthase/GTP cyclohydrolase II